jgi:ABC-2 type transport system ATP-binding protein
MATLSARSLTKRFESTCAIDDLDLELGEGEVRGLLGPNGAGKTTLLRMLLGLVKPDAGTIALFGRSLEDPGRLDDVAGFVEEPSFYPYLSARANLEILAELDGGGSSGRIDGALEQVELSARADDRVGGFSTGMRKRLGIAAALVRAPRLLLLDEPTAGLDPGGVRFVGALLRSLSAEGVTVLLSSHQIGEVEEMCDGFSVLRRGQVVWEGSMAQMRLEAPSSGYLMSTSKDARAHELAGRQEGVAASLEPGGGIAVEAGEAALDRFVLALASEQIAVRRLELTLQPLESMFFALTDEQQGDPHSAATAPSDDSPSPS